MNWTGGYTADIEYIHRYIAQLNPLGQRFALLATGLAVSESKIACELGYGQGLSANFHAAAGSTEWWGTDFNPAHASSARQLAELAGTGARLFDQAFAEFCARPDLPDFDMIGLHGIWTWISDENRTVLVDFIRRRLKPGGVLYISYNTLPGCAALAPIQHIIKRHYDVMTPLGQNVVQRIEEAIAFVDTLLGVDPLYLRTSPKIMDALKEMKGSDRRYLIHEYMNSNWNPMHVADMAKWLEPTKCCFACSANYLDHIDAINLTIEQEELLKSISDPIFQQTVRDLMVNRRFRQDYWVKGVRHLSPLEKSESLGRERVVLTCPRSDIPSTIWGTRFKLSESAYTPILDVLADYWPRSLAEIAQALQKGGIDTAQSVQNIIILASRGYLQPVQDERRTEEVTASTARLNALLIDKARSNDEIGGLASPVTGGGIAVSRLQQLFLLAGRNACEAPLDRAAFVWSILKGQGGHFIKDNRIIEGDEDNLAELTAQAQTFVEKAAPVLKALGIA